MRKTPIERAIAAQVDPKARYEKAQRDKGLTRIALWVPVDQVETFKKAAKDACARAVVLPGEDQ